MQNKNPLNIILLGISGSGKGTQAKFLCQRYGLEYIGTGDLLRTFAKKDNPASRKLKKDLSEGKLAPTWLPFYLWMDKLVEVDEKKGILFDGSPRKIHEAELLDEVLDWYDRKNIKVILIDVSEKEVFKRLINRRTCQSCKKSAYVSQNQGDSICEYCGGVMHTRPEDNPDAIKKRIEWFKKEVSQVIDFYKKKGMLIKVNGDQPKEKVFEDIINAIEKNDNDKNTR